MFFLFVFYILLYIMFKKVILYKNSDQIFFYWLIGFNICRPRWLSWMRCLTGDQEVTGSTPPQGRQHSFVEIDHEIFSMVIFLPPI